MLAHCQLAAKVFNKKTLIEDSLGMMTHFFFAAFKVFCLSHFLVAGNNTPHPQIEGGVYAGFYFRSVVAGYQERKAQ